jgi:Dolichyl-phosphate-mannose-protein mannosyltransferase
MLYMDMIQTEEQQYTEIVVGNRASGSVVTPSSLHLCLLAVVLALLIGGAIRLIYVIHNDFPLNDGGLFFTMTEDLRAANYSTPFYTSYNGGHIPYTYPPLAFYMNAALEDVFGISGLVTVRIITLISTTLLILGVYQFSRTIGLLVRQVSIATVAYATLPAGFEWLVTGGGLTRAPALLFSLLMLLMVYRAYIKPSPWNIVLATFFGGLTILTHPATGVFAFYSAVILFLFYGRGRRALIHSLLIAIGVLLLSSPWWLNVIAIHGPMPLFNAMHTGEHDLGSFAPLIFFNFSGETVLQIMAVVGLIGLFICIADGKMLLPIWIVTIFVLSPRGASTYAAIPLALLVGVGMDRAVLPALLKPSYRLAEIPRLSRVTITMVLVFFLWYALISALLPILTSSGKTTSLQPEERQAMSWVAANTPLTSRFVVVTGEENWAIDRVSEWFPSLTNRVSLATFQGTEWLPISDQTKTQYSALQQCAIEEASCLEHWSNITGLSFHYIYIPRLQASMNSAQCCERLLMSLDQTSSYNRIYDGPGAIIFVRQP